MCVCYVCMRQRQKQLRGFCSFTSQSPHSSLNHNPPSQPLSSHPSLRRLLSLLFESCRHPFFSSARLVIMTTPIRVVLLLILTSNSPSFSSPPTWLTLPHKDELSRFSFLSKITFIQQFFIKNVYFLSLFTSLIPLYICFAFYITYVRTYFVPIFLLLFFTFFLPFFILLFCSLGFFWDNLFLDFGFFMEMRELSFMCVRGSTSCPLVNQYHNAWPDYTCLPLQY